MAERSRWTYRDASALAAWVQRLSWLQAAASVGVVLLVWLRRFEPEYAGLAEGGLLIVQTILFFVLVFLSLRWIYIANANARALGAEDMMVNPGWAVGWFFVPLVNLVMPFVMMRELWKASARPGDWQMEPAPAAILAWWLSWLASGITAGIGLQLSLRLEKEAASAAELFHFVSDLVLIPAVLLFAWIVGRIQAMQSRSVPTAVFA